MPLNRDISHQHKRLQHLAGRYLLQHLFPDFPYELIQIADTRKPFLFNEAYHFSISHCNDYAAALVSRRRRVGVDIELVTPTIEKIQHKFLSDEEIASLRLLMLNNEPNDNGQPVYEHATGVLLTSGNQPAGGVIAPPAGSAEPAGTMLQWLTLCWSAKEAMYKWYGNGLVDFKKHMQLTAIHEADHGGWIQASFTFQKEKPVPLMLRSRFFGNAVVTFVIS